MAEDTDIYNRENENLQKYKEFLKNGGYSHEELQLNYKNLIEHYGELLSQVKIITRISDRLQKKLDKANAELNEANEQLHEKNVQLQETIDALTQARVGRRAATVTLLVAIVLFIVSEALVEPRIEKWAIDYYKEASMAFWVGIILKFVLALLLKPIETVTERVMLRRARQQAIKARAIHNE